MKFREIVRFEVVYQFRRRSTWFFFAAFLLLLFGQTIGQVIDSESREIVFNAPILVAQTTATMTLVALLILAAVAGNAATRDLELRVEPLMHSAPVGRATYLGGRLVGTFLVMAILLAVVPLALVLATVVPSGQIIAPLRPAVFLQPYFLLLLPNVLVATALMFSLATLVRHTLGSYFGAGLIFAGTLFSRGYLAGVLDRWELAQLLDCTGITAVHVRMSSWSPADLTGRLVGLEGTLLWNRLLWLFLAFVAVAFTTMRFRRDAGTVRWWRRGSPSLAHAGALDRYAPVVVPDAPREFGSAGRVRQTLAIARDSLREIGTGWTWLAIPFVLLLVALNQDLLEAQGTPLLPTTDRVMETFEGSLNAIFVFVVFFAGELVWRERDANMQSLSDAAPVPDAVRFAGKLLGLWASVVALHGMLMLAGIGTQLSLGWYDLDPALYLQILFGLDLIGPLVFALLALSVHVMVNHKHVGHVVMLLLVLVMNGLTAELGIEHPLLIYGSGPGWRHSAISGFGPSVGPVLWFELYWAAWTVLLAIVARLFWVNGVNPALRERLRVARRRLTGRTTGLFAAALGLVLAVGGFIFYNTNVLNPYRSSERRNAQAAEYERRYKRYSGAAQPELRSTELNVELHPERREAAVRGVYHLLNRTAQPIETIHVALGPAVETRAIDFGRAAHATHIDDELRHRIYRLDRPLAPGESLQLRWEVRHDPRGFTVSGVRNDVVPNGTVILTNEWFPILGYQPGRELSDAGVRKKYGLPVRVGLASLHDVAARNARAGRERTDLKVTVVTSADQTAVAPGELRRSWTRDGRRTFEYATAAPIGLGYAIFSADYAVRKSSAAGVQIEVVHHPRHDRNVGRMIHSMEACLEQFTRRFGPYPHKVLRMVEYPAAGGNLHAASGTIWYKELFSLFDPDRDPRQFDLVSAVVGHEVAHQFQPVPARVEGIGLLSESFAWYAAMGVVEEEFGDAHLQRLLRFFRTSYLRPRARADVPLLRADDSFQAYRQGPFAMNALRAYVGQDKVDLAWRRVIDRHRSGEPPYATSLELLRELQQVTPDSLRYLLVDLFERNTFWDLETTQSTAKAMPDGRWRVSLEVVAKKLVVDEKGAATEVAMNDLIQIGLFGPDEAGGERGTPLYLAMHRIRSGTQTITLTVPHRPASAGIDPRHLLIDTQPDDNVAKISESGREAQAPGAFQGPLPGFD
ncbi:MAG: ABC transporter permease [Thermoanaerobaculia bacterium]